MELRSGLRPDKELALNGVKGFTLIEVVIAITLLIVIFGLGFFASWDFYRAYAKNAEKSVIISVLQKARSHSINNINQVRHGVRFTRPLQYIIFECAEETPQCVNYDQANKARDLAISPAYGIAISGTPFDVVFEQLSGASANTIIMISDGTAITINTEGQISW